MLKSGECFIIHVLQFPHWLHQIWHLTENMLFVIVEGFFAFPHLLLTMRLDMLAERKRHAGVSLHVVSISGLLFESTSQCQLYLDLLWFKNKQWLNYINTVECIEVNKSITWCITYAKTDGFSAACDNTSTLNQRHRNPDFRLVSSAPTSKQTELPRPAAKVAMDYKHIFTLWEMHLHVIT